MISEIFRLLLTSKLVSEKSKLYLSLQNSWTMQLGAAENVLVTRQQPQVDRLLQLMQQRLMIAHDVAGWKWNQKRPIEDSQREQELVAKLRQQATAYGLEPDTLAAFFQAQIEAGKLIQKTDFQTWHQQGVQFFTNVPDLNQTTRPSLDKLNTEFLAVLAEITPALGCRTLRKLIQSRAEIILRGDGIDRTVQRIALSPLKQI